MYHIAEVSHCAIFEKRLFSLYISKHQSVCFFFFKFIHSIRFVSTTDEKQIYVFVFIFGTMAKFIKALVWILIFVCFVSFFFDEKKKKIFYCYEIDDYARLKIEVIINANFNGLLFFLIRFREFLFAKQNRKMKE